LSAVASSQVAIDRFAPLVHVPASYDGSAAVPLVILLHGYGSVGTEIEAFFDFVEVSEATGIIYAAPHGTMNPQGFLFWNATNVCCDYYYSGVDDSGYLRSLIENMQATYNIDARRIYVAGLSNGGFMAYRMACDHADLIAGIVSVAGATYFNAGACAPTEPIHVLHIHGTADESVIYEGGSLRGVPYPGAVQSVETWATYNGCDLTPFSPPDTLDLDADIPGAETTITRYPDGCLPGGSAELWTVNGGPHVLSGTPDFGMAIAGFISSHPKAAPPPPIPAASDWGLVTLTLFMLTTGSWLLRRPHSMHATVQSRN